MAERHFLFLQGPHGPFFSDLAGLLKQAGTKVSRIGFNAGDAHFWKHKDDYTPFTDSKDGWPEFLRDFLKQQEITDLVLYGDTRFIHAKAREIARELALTVHCFEEGYLRPYWVTYEHGGVNGHSPLMNMTVSEMRAQMGDVRRPVPEAPAQWGALWHHIYLGALYHWHILFRNGAYRNYRPHRTISVRKEWFLYIRRLALFPFHVLERKRETQKLHNSGANYHLVLLQLAHDSSFTEHSDFNNIGEFIDLCCKGFAEGAPKYHRLVFKTHPLEDGREPLRQIIRDCAAAYGVGDRVQMIRGGKLGPMMDHATTAVTVNSTAGQQVLWRGMPLRIFGRSVYAKPEFVSEQPLAEFFANPKMPDTDAYRDYRQYLLETSQFTGGFYTGEGRAEVLRNIVHVMLESLDPYEERCRKSKLRKVWDAVQP
ncbi:capsule biosynthesis protein [Algicella marina]|uniref:Capsule biosynthesis protein CapA n=1 Tax=Algicella marina TaxID=2683284 RepID=A0A6P1SX33_9RHOB|nr:capsule biosynthesis protein CapA [Algicella marina]QHQ33893.1 capsule biosynthesis protein CapA [Algicella marina]